MDGLPSIHSSAYVAAYVNNYSYFHGLKFECFINWEIHKKFSSQSFGYHYGSHFDNNIICDWVWENWSSLNINFYLILRV